MMIDTAIDWYKDLDPALSLARKKDRPVFLDFWAHGCVGCMFMEDVTYKDERVIEQLERDFVAVKINVEDQPEVASRYNLLWTPVLVGLTGHNFVLRQIVGYLPPVEMLPELSLLCGMHQLRSARPARALERFSRLANDYPDSPAAPEALYWGGVAAYRRTQDKADLWVIWRELVEKYPTSAWAGRTTLLSERVQSEA